MTEAEKKRRTRSAYRILNSMVRYPAGMTSMRKDEAERFFKYLMSVVDSAADHLQNFDYEEDER